MLPLPKGMRAEGFDMKSTLSRSSNQRLGEPQLRQRPDDDAQGAGVVRRQVPRVREVLGHGARGATGIDD